MYLMNPLECRKKKALLNFKWRFWIIYIYIHSGPRPRILYIFSTKRRQWCIVPILKIATFPHFILRILQWLIFNFRPCYLISGTSILPCCSSHQERKDEYEKLLPLNASKKFNSLNDVIFMLILWFCYQNVSVVLSPVLRQVYDDPFTYRECRTELFI